MNAMEAIKKVKKDRRIERKLANGLTEVKCFWGNGQIAYHYFKDENGNLHGEYKWFWDDGIIGGHELYEDGKLVKDYLL